MKDLHNIREECPNLQFKKKETVEGTDMGHRFAQIKTKGLSRRFFEMHRVIKRDEEKHDKETGTTKDDKNLSLGSGLVLGPRMDKRCPY